MSCQTFSRTGLGGNFSQAIVYAADNGAIILQNSWGYTTAGKYDQSILDAIDYFIDNAGYDANNNPVGPMQGGIVIFAAGNNNRDGLYYPGCYPKVLAVGATDNKDKKAYFSNYGNWVDVSAPGVSILSTGTGSSYITMSGTSMACPHVSGLAALIVSHFKYTITPQTLWSRITELTDNIDSRNPGYEKLLGTGRINAFNSLQNSDTISPADITDLSVVESGQTTIKLTWTTQGGSADSGYASNYYCRFSLHPINEGNFNQATLYYDFKRPLKAGTIDTFILKNLIPDTTYYIALKTSDVWGNISWISNVVSIRTKIAPRFEIAEQHLYQEQKPSEKKCRNVMIQNTGKADLIFNIVYNNPESEALPGISKYSTSENTTSTITTPLFATDGINSRIVSLNPTNGEVISEIHCPFEIKDGGPYGMAYDGKYIYCNKPIFLNNGKVFILNKLGQVLDSLLIPDTQIVNGLGVINGRLYVCDNWSNKISEIELKTKTVNRIIKHNIGFILGLSAAADRNSLFISREGIEELDLATGTIRKVIDSNTIYSGLGYSLSKGNLFAFNTHSDLIEAIDPDNGEILYSFSSEYGDGLASDESIPEYNWLTVENLSDTLKPGENASFKVCFNSDSLIAGDYENYFKIYTNDPYNEIVKAPVSLKVVADSISVEIKTNEKKLLKIFPNPVNKVINIQNLKETATVSIYNIQGKLNKNVILERSQSSIDLSEMPSGIYFMKIYTKSGITKFKFIKTE